jgi:hypothetical protein
MDSRVAKNLAQKLAGTIHDAGLSGETWVRRHKPGDFDNSCNTVKVTDRELDGSQRVSGSDARETLGIGWVNLAWHFASCRQNAINHRQLACRKHQIARCHSRNIGRDRWHNRRQRGAELQHPCFNNASH